VIGSSTLPSREMHRKHTLLKRKWRGIETSSRREGAESSMGDDEVLEGGFSKGLLRKKEDSLTGNGS